MKEDGEEANEEVKGSFVHLFTDKPKHTESPGHIRKWKILIIIDDLFQLAGTVLGWDEERKEGNEGEERIMPVLTLIS